MSIKTLLLSCATGLTLTACTVGPDYQKPDLEVTKWSQEHNENKSLTEWWKVFKDPVLTALVSETARNNLDVKIAQARVLEARALRNVADASLFPSLGTAGGFSRLKQSKNDPQFIQGPPGSGISIPRIQNRYQASFDASWEFDIFGGNRRAVEAAGARLEAQDASLRNIVLTAVSELVRNYFELRGNQNRLAIIQEKIEIQEQTVEATANRVKSGIARDFELLSARAQLESTRSSLPNIKASIRNASFRMDVLRGKQPGTLLPEILESNSMPVVDEVVPVGLPSELLRRRPDIQIAERQLAASTADIGVAISDLYPKFNLTGSFGTLASDSPNDLIESASETWLFSPFIKFPIFESGRLRANIKAAEARESQAAYAYERAVLTALQDVESALLTYAREQETLKGLTSAAAAAGKASDRIHILYEQGLEDILAHLFAKRESLKAQEALIQSETRAMINLVALYKSLGGGWEAFEPQKPLAVTHTSE